MEPTSRIEIIDRDGWRKEYPVTKTLVHIGSDSRNDIVLDGSRGAGVAPRHLQFILMPTSPTGYSVVNLADNDITVGDAGGRTVNSRSSSDINDGERIQLGDFTLIFRAGSRANLPALPGGGSGAIGLTIAIPNNQLEPNYPLTGVVTVRNLGTKTGVQFKLEVVDMDPEFYTIGPGPVLFPNAAKEVAFQIFHPRKPSHTAGEHRITIRATAPDAYPGEKATVTQSIQILPYYSHSLLLAPVE